ncbi:CooT family nickel-binding protein [Methanococcus aeolicus]|uniref:CooT family nickel-binding protein n=1 Tax=Methanococcus aeolicus TaxID=42879 RepID=UPI0021C9336F|nr:CooT family nickel-binding protein [Methanococcus aeolicus]UXM85113.1 CooT family nickel-binding protein [Methanococcus aeolicus]
MCNINLYLNDEIIMEDIMSIEKKLNAVNTLVAIDLFGDKKEFENSEIIKVDLNENKIIIREIK